MDRARDTADLFERPLTYPDVEAQERLAALVGLDQQKLRLAKILSLLVNPERLKKWARVHHPDAERLVASIQRRPPLVVLAGDVGSGKTALAETIGDVVARDEDIDVVLLPLSLSARGQGRVGEMTQLLAAVFDATLSEAKKLKCGTKKARGAVILLVDEADALAQSRETSQMHHEDRAGVNAFIRGVDQLATNKLPAAVIMCTNRLGALDPAVKRRAADILEFGRPGESQRHEVLAQLLRPLGFSPEQMDELVQATGPKNGASIGFTYSDLVQRLIPAFVLDAYPTRPLDASRAIEIARDMVPTPPFQEMPP